MDVLHTNIYANIFSMLTNFTILPRHVLFHCLLGLLWSLKKMFRPTCRNKMTMYVMTVFDCECCAQGRQCQSARVQYMRASRLKINVLECSLTTRNCVPSRENRSIGTWTDETTFAIPIRIRHVLWICRTCHEFTDFVPIH